MGKLAASVSAGACVLAVVVLGGCDSSSPDEPEAPAGTAPVRTEQTPGTEVPAQETAPGTGPAQQWAMPNLVGSTLQDAQDKIQSVTGGAVLISTSHDLSGEDRSQVLDANWKVCTQNVESGAPLTTASLVDFGVVKVDESCP